MQHGRAALVGGVQDVEDPIPNAGGDDEAVVVQEDVLPRVQFVPILVVLLAFSRG